MFNLLWHEIPRNALAAKWIGSDSNMRKAISVAANEIDRILTHDPVGCGESRSDRRRILFFPPLAIIYRVDEDDRGVLIQECWFIRRRKP